MRPVKKLPPGYVAPPITPKPGPKPPFRFILPKPMPVQVQPKTGSGSLGFIADKLKGVTGSGFKKGGKTTTLHSITKSSKKSNW